MAVMAKEKISLARHEEKRGKETKRERKKKISD
jgi:hypothetical protein